MEKNISSHNKNGDIKMTQVLSVSCALSLVLGFAVISYGGSATCQVQVTARVVSSCTVSTTPVDFGNARGVGISHGNGDITVNCKAGTRYRIELDAGRHLNTGDNSGNMRHVVSGSCSVPYSVNKGGSTDDLWGNYAVGHIFSDAPSVADIGIGAARPHTVYGCLWNFSGIPVGPMLTDTVTVTVFY